MSINGLTIKEYNLLENHERKFLKANSIAGLKRVIERSIKDGNITKDAEYWKREYPPFYSSAIKLGWLK
jgi:hypothetical protein